MTVEAWVDEFAQKVCARDVEGALSLFHPDCLSFGTRILVARDRGELAAHQWTPIWNATTNFQFTEIATVAHGSDAVVIAAQWSSTANLDKRQRSGRATLVLVSDPSARHGWVCTHTHFSLPPQAEAL